jgi:hypothetical protein
VSAAPGERGRINDAATQLALLRLAESRERLGGWASEMSARVASRRDEGLGALGFGNFNPRSETLKMLMSLVLPRLPWIRWAFSAFSLFRAFRRR